MHNEVKILVFKLNEEFYATDIKDVERILGYTNPTILPEAPIFVEGVINYENNILPIINLAQKFLIDFKKDSDKNKIIVIKECGVKIGVVVESVSEVRDISENLIEKPPVIAINDNQKYVKGLIKLENKIIILLDFAKLLNEEEKLQIS